MQQNIDRLAAGNLETRQVASQQYVCQKERRPFSWDNPGLLARVVLSSHLHGLMRDTNGKLETCNAQIELFATNCFLLT